MKVIAKLLALISVVTACHGGTKVNDMDAKDFFKDPKQLELAIASARGDISRIDRLVGGGADVNYVGEEGMTALIWALGAQSKKGVSALLKHGANPNYIASNGVSAMSLAAGAEDIEFLKMLLENGGDPNLFDSEEEQPMLMISLMQDRKEHMGLLLEKGANINLKDGVYGDTALMKAAKIQLYDHVYFLLNRGADPFVKNPRNKTVMTYIKRSIDRNNIVPDSENYIWREKSIQLLREKGINVDDY